MNKITIINGPNLNMLGRRPASIYGAHNYQDLINLCKETGEIHNLEIDFFHSNSEGEIIDKIQSLNRDGLIINPGAYSHTSVAIYDALEILTIPIIEVHLSNLYKREEFRQKSITAKAAKGIISGFGIESYKLAIIMISQVT